MLDEIKRAEGNQNQDTLETTAGQGTNLEYRFEHLAEILKLLKYPDRIGICFDTCHSFVAGMNSEHLRYI
jgi:deoxyribonuclease-4